jgi:hypothetical protein
MKFRKKLTGCEGVDWIILAQAAVKWRELVKTLMTSIIEKIPFSH